MKIVTVNVPESYIDSMDKLVGGDGLYPSRSELIRVACREFLIKELRLARQLLEQNMDKEEKIDNEKYVRVPYNDPKKGKKEPVREFKTYKIIKKLDY